MTLVAGVRLLAYGRRRLKAAIKRMAARYPLARTALSGAQRLRRRLRRGFKRDPDAFLKACTGVIHVGAHLGQERDDYARLGLYVAWVEPIPEIFNRLEENIRPHPRQSAYRYLLAQEDGVEYELKVSNNDGASSSILPFARHEDVWPDVKMCRTIAIPGTTLRAFIEGNNIDTSRYNALVLDTHGAELGILRSGGAVIRQFAYVKVEAADFEAYAGAPMLSDIEEYMKGVGFEEFSRNRFMTRPGIGSFFDVVYRRRDFDGP